MKNQVNNVRNKKGPAHLQHPENKDNLDSRKSEEQTTKGDDVTHNVKATKENK